MGSLLEGFGNKLLPYSNGFPHLIQVLFGQYWVLLKHGAAVKVDKSGDPHIGGAVQPYFLLVVFGLLHSLHKALKFALAGMIKINRNMKIVHAQISDGLLLIVQRIFHPMGSEINHCFKASGGNAGKLFFGGLA